MTGKKQILIVEDDHSIAELQKDYLELAGYGVTIAANGTEALDLIARNEYDLVILDIMLPGADGFTVLQTIREREDIPVLLVSARSEDLYKIKGLDLGADDYVTKPFSPAELVARVNAHVKKYERLRERFGGSRAVHATNRLRVRRLEIDKEARQVYVNGREVSLAQKEFDLLLFLLQHANRVFSKEELFERVWGLDALGDVSTVTVHIARIREKIEDNPSKPQYIATVWGSGYKFII